MTQYFANPSRAALSAMAEGALGYIDTPSQGNRRPRVQWCADNGVFSPTRAKKGIEWDAAGWWRWLQAQAADADLCTFAVAPDVLHWKQDETGAWFPVGDHAATAELSRQWIPAMKQLGFRVAYVLQDGCTVDEVPWAEIDAVFIGGSDDWKVGPAGLDRHGNPLGEVPVAPLVAEARRQGKWVHMGRVNSRKRYLFANRMLELTGLGQGGCDSVDGTYLTFGPEKNLPKVLAWKAEAAPQPARDDEAEAAHTGADYGWEPVDAGHNVGYARGAETLAVMYAGGRAVHVTHTTDAWGDTPVRRSAAGAEALPFLLATLAA